MYGRVLNVNTPSFSGRMLNCASLLLLLALLCTAQGAKEHGVTTAARGMHRTVSYHNPIEDDDLFEGDLKISPEMIREYYDIPGDGVSKRAASRSVMKLWPNGTVPYDIGKRMSSRTRRLISKSIAHWENETCLRFVPAFVGSQQLYTDYVMFIRKFRGCYSNSIGRLGGKQVINLGRGCGSLVIIVHEIGHAVGFFHEQSRPDRAQYVKILWDNIRKNNHSNFKKRRASKVNSHGVGYDYSSVMHYGRRELSKNGKPTMEIVNHTQFEAQLQGKPPMGQQKYLSASDILQTNLMYNCTV